MRIKTVVMLKLTTREEVSSGAKNSSLIPTIALKMYKKIAMKIPLIKAAMRQ